MAGVAILLFVVFLLGAFAIVFGMVNLLTGTGRSRRKRRQSKNAILAPIRSRFGAENLRPNRLGEVNVFRPALLFDYGRTMARLKHFGTPWGNAARKTILEVDFELPVGQTLSVESRSLDSDAAVENFETGDADFDRQFCVHASDPVFAKQLLTDAVKWKMIELKGLHPAEIRFEFENDRLRTISKQWFRHGRDLLDFVQGGLELFDQLMLHKADGLEFLRENQAAVIEDFRCPICSDDVMHDMVVCKRCKTPHCAECWEYNGKCATFACMEERCIRVQEHEL
ncbi:RING finger protein [Mariniblastus fucicola]|uniref:Uncharacterized protein n=1 Tax=Mariniblastus fucicola TaxID=980251 RepID=A0A5B9PH79_9BACT|nr:RING finger protein [Mariniblastus fucicola]QEG24640.1 hypothetical protein MFFC18_45610 [Mariniblastus fucicola]